MLAYSQGDNTRAAISAGRAADLARELGDKRLLAIVLGFEASSLMFTGETEIVHKLLEEALAAGRESGDVLARGLPMGLGGQAMTLLGGDAAVAHAQAEEGAALLQQSGDRWSANMALLGMAMTATFIGNYADARARFSALGPRFAELGDRHRVNMVKSELAHIDRREGNFEKAESAYRETILEWKRLGHRAAIAHQLECFASIAQTRANGPRAARLYGAADALREKISIAMTPVEKTEYDRLVSELRSSMDEEGFTLAWADGRLMSADQAIQFALETKQVSPAGPAAK